MKGIILYSVLSISVSMNFAKPWSLSSSEALEVALHSLCFLCRYNLWQFCLVLIRSDFHLFFLKWEIHENKFMVVLQVILHCYCCRIMWGFEGTISHQNNTLTILTTRSASKLWIMTGTLKGSAWVSMLTLNHAIAGFKRCISAVWVFNLHWKAKSN